MFCTMLMLEKVSRIHKTYLLDQQLFCRRHFSKTEVVQNTDLNILAFQYINLLCDGILLEIQVLEPRFEENHILLPFPLKHKSKIDDEFR